MTRHFSYGPTNFPSRVAAPDILKELFGADFDDGGLITADALAEVRPHRPAGRGGFETEEPMFVAEVETETHIFRAVFPAPLDWFTAQIPMSIFLNIPNDASSLDRTELDSTEADEVDQLKRLLNRWADGKNPRRTTALLLTKVARHHEHLRDTCLPAVAVLDASKTKKLSVVDRSLVIRTLVQVIRELINPSDTKDKAA